MRSSAIRSWPSSPRSNAQLSPRGILFVIAGPSGVGKGTVVRRVLQQHPEIWLSVSVTTRSPRPGEEHGVDYLFVSDGRFDDLVDRGALLEWALVVGHRSGTPVEPIERELAAGRDVILEIDVQGARQVKARVPEAVLVFLAPPSMEELERRLRSRGTEDEEKLALRLATAQEEMGEMGWFDHVVVNECLDEATAQVEAILQTSRSPTQGRTPP
ncbi:MAG: guanylate kinase [Actinomycetota bacterium]